MHRKKVSGYRLHLKNPLEFKGHAHSFLLLAWEQGCSVIVAKQCMQVDDAKHMFTIRTVRQLGTHQELCQVFGETAPQPPTYSSLSSWLDPPLAWVEPETTCITNKINVVETFVLLDHRQCGSQGQLGLQDEGVKAEKQPIFLAHFHSSTI